MIEKVAEANYYQVLGVAQDASSNVIRIRYRQMMQSEANHPDLGGDTATAALINKAYAVLSNAAQRMEYDARLNVLRQVASGFSISTGNSQAYFSTPDPLRECVFCATPHGNTTINDAESRCDNCRCPLQPVTHRRLERWDQRAIARIPKSIPVHFYTDWRQTEGRVGQTEDLSLNGVSVLSESPLQPGQAVRLVTSMLDAVGYVVRCRPRRCGWKTEHVVGIHFVTLCMMQSEGGFVSERI